jgi:acyl-CoA dehydrogenase
VHSDIVAHYLLNHGTEDQKRRFLPAMASGRCIGAIAMTEPGAGSDLQAIRTVARKVDGGWVINGSKTFITNGQNCGLVIVAARTDPAVPAAKGMTLFIVEDGMDGFTRGRNLEKLGHHASDTSELHFSDVFVTEEQVLGEVNRGFFMLMDELPRERVALALSAVGGADHALELTRRYALERSAFGSPLAGLQNTRFEMARMESEIRVNLAYVRECLERHAAGTLDTVSASVAKLTTTEMQGRVVDACLQIFGGYGYMLEYPISRAYADARIQRIYGGTSEIMCEVIARELLSA